MAQPVIIIPARYGSTRLPGKPLALIAGQTMLARVVSIAKQGGANVGAQVLVATDDDRIVQHCQNDLGVDVVMTPPECPTGSDRVFEAAKSLVIPPSFVLNLQGDAPLTPPHFVAELLKAYLAEPEFDVVTPVSQLSWAELDKLRANKQATPFSGTTAVVQPATNEALWFSKNIIPAIRKEEVLRAKSNISPVFGHVGLYGYKFEALQKFVSLPEGAYEALEGLEQLRFLENNMRIKAVPVSYNGLPKGSGVDSPEDVLRVEKLLQEHGLK
jgi:3-deoxy-manno-octulosonate cytidylyltransferase (CMP-KDO synthetase)